MNLSAGSVGIGVFLLYIMFLLRYSVKQKNDKGSRQNEKRKNKCDAHFRSEKSKL